MKKRIEFSRINVYKSAIKDENPENPEDPSPTTLPEIGIEFRLQGETLSGYSPQYASKITDEMGNFHPAMGGWPEMELSFSVPDADLPRAQAWIDNNYHDVSTPESATLISNRRKAVFTALNSYMNTARSHNLFTNPLRLGWSMKLTDGTLTDLTDCGIYHTFMTAPTLPITSDSLSEKTFHSRAQLRNIPGRLQLRIAGISDPASYPDRIQEIEIFATRQAETYDDSGNVGGIRTITVDGTPMRCWQYDRYTADEVRLKAEQSVPFRRIASISFDEIEDFEQFLNIPLAAGTLTDFATLPTYDSLKKGETTAGDNPSDDTTGWTRFVTEYMHLDYPENEKSIHGVTLRGVFDRRNVRIRLYGSQHRERRILLGSTRGAYMRGLCCSRIRWLQVEIDCDMREGDFLEAITFDFSV